MITLEHLTKSYGAIRAVDGVTMRIEQGEVFGLLGPNGAGKSTTIRMLTTLTRPDGGRAAIAGYDILKERQAIRQIIGVVPQEINLDRELTADENLFIYALLHHLPQMREKITACLTLVGLLNRRDSIVSAFSGGMQRRLLLARALLTDPTVLFLDEPSIGLDPQIRRQLWDIIRGSSGNGRTVIITTHYIEEAETLCNRVAILNRGRLIALGTPSQLKEEMGPYVVEYIDEDGKLVQHLSRNREEAHQYAATVPGAVTIRHTNLEDVFVQLTGERIE